MHSILLILPGCFRLRQDQVTGGANSSQDKQTGGEIISAPYMQSCKWYDFVEFNNWLWSCYSSRKNSNFRTHDIVV